MVKTSKSDVMIYPPRYSVRLQEARCKAETERYLKKFKSQQKALDKCAAEYWSRVGKSDGFDIDHVEGSSHCKMLVFKTVPECSSVLVTLYAKMGLHRYNMVQGTDLQFDHIEKYNRYVALIPSSYFITLVAKNPATGSLEQFQTRIHERKYGQMDITCYVARLKNTGTVGAVWNDGKPPQFRHLSVPKWPKGADENQFYMVQESEWEENDWIRLYLELGFVTNNRRIPNPKLSDLKIVEVMVETSKDHQPLKGFRDATVYIKYIHDLGDGSFCKRRAIIRRGVDLRTEYMCLEGRDYQEGESESESESGSDK